MALKVLIVDDQPTIRRIAIRLLRERGAECLEAGTAARALDILKSESVGLVVTDWNMPGMSGIDFLRTVRSRDHLKTTPVVMMTSRNYEEDIVAAMRAGVTGYIVKPFGRTMFLAQIAAALASSSSHVSTAAKSFHQ
jgi:two-component system, chemotaxis family, chemotaxis protein CheY